MLLPSGRNMSRAALLAVMPNVSCEQRESTVSPTGPSVGHLAAGDSQQCPLPRPWGYAVPISTQSECRDLVLGGRAGIRRGGGERLRQSNVTQLK